MKNDGNLNKYNTKSKLTLLKSSDNILELEPSTSNNSLKSPNLLSVKAQDGNKINFKQKENQGINSNNHNKIFEFKENFSNIQVNNKNNNNMNNNFPSIFINPSPVNNGVNNARLNKNFNSTVMESNSPINKNLTHETLKDLFKLNSELNMYLDPNKSTRFRTIEDEKIKHKTSKSHFSHRLRPFNNTLLNQNNTKTFISTNKNQNSNNIFNKTSKLRKNYNQNIEPELQMINLDKYNTLVTETMGNYRIESMPADLNNENLDEILQTQNRTLGFPAFNKTSIGKSNNNLNITYGENAFMKIMINEKDYVNPSNSSKILDTNKNIFNNISTSLINIQKMYYDKTINRIEKYNEFKKNMCKVRVSNIMPKNTDFLMLFKSKDSIIDKNPNLMMKGSSQSNNNLTGLLKNNLTSKSGSETPFGGSNKERSAESIEKEKILEKQREKERERERERENRKEKKKKNEIKFKNKIIRPDEMELYAYYKYSTKNFPEGREQFAFDYNLSEIVLFGGIVTNKNNHVWTLDPSNF